MVEEHPARQFRAELLVFRRLKDPEMPDIVDLFRDGDIAVTMDGHIEIFEQLFDPGEQVLARQRIQFALEIKVHLRVEKSIAKLAACYHESSPSNWKGETRASRPV